MAQALTAVAMILKIGEAYPGMSSHYSEQGDFQGARRKCRPPILKSLVLSWDAFGHSDVQFSLKVRKTTKKLETGSWVLPAPELKRRKRVEKELHVLEHVSFESDFDSFGAL